VSRRELSVPAGVLVEIAPGVRLAHQEGRALRIVVDVDKPAAGDRAGELAAAWQELAAATTALGTAAAQFDAARARYVAARDAAGSGTGSAVVGRPARARAGEPPRRGPPAAEGGAPTAH
jgi:hypothetical protein